MERSVELADDIVPYHVSVCNLIEIFLYVCSEPVIQDMREVLDKVVSDYHSDILWKQSVLLCSYSFCLGRSLDLAVFETKVCDCLLHSRLVSFDHIAASLGKSRDGRCIC